MLERRHASAPASPAGECRARPAAFKSTAAL